MVQPKEFSVAYAAAVEAVYAEHFGKHLKSLVAPKFVVEPGKRFDKIVQVEGDYIYGGKSVHAFVEREDGPGFKQAGNVFKAAGWSAPAKGVRGNVAVDGGLEALFARPGGVYCGGYLYAGR